MQENRKRIQVYKTKRWKELRQVIIDRDKGICFFCGQLVLKRLTIHHIEELNESNWRDEEVAYNPENLVLCHADCHDMHHKRFGYKESIVDANLNIDYDKRIERS